MIFSQGVNSGRKDWFKDFFSLSICLFIAFTLFFPVLFINKLIFASIILTYLAYVLFVKDKIPNIITPILLVSIFSMGFLYGVIKGGIDMGLSIQFLFSTTILFLLYPILQFKIDVTSYIKKISTLYALASILLALFSYYNLIELNVVLFLTKYALIASGYRDFLGFNQYFSHIGTVPFLVIPLYLFLADKTSNKVWKFLNITILIVTIYLSSSRALYLTSFLVFILTFYNSFENKSKVVVGTFIAFISIAVFLFLYSNTMIFNLNEYSNSIKLGHLLSAFKQIDIRQLLIGNGLGSIYFSEGAGRLTAHTELTYVDLIRYFGVIYSFLILVFLIFPRTLILKSRSTEFLIFLLYLIVSATNPTLFNSYGLIVVLWYWNQILGEPL